MSSRSPSFELTSRKLFPALEEIPSIASPREACCNYGEAVQSNGDYVVESTRVSGGPITIYRDENEYIPVFRRDNGWRRVILDAGEETTLQYPHQGTRWGRKEGQSPDIDLSTRDGVLAYRASFRPRVDLAYHR